MGVRQLEQLEEGEEELGMEAVRVQVEEEQVVHKGEVKSPGSI